MTTPLTPVTAPPPKAQAAGTTMAGRRDKTVSWLLRRGGLHLVLLIICLIWLVPTVGLFITSLRPRPDIGSTGWWTILQAPRLSFDNYADVLGSKGMSSGFLNSLFISIPSTIIPVLVGALAAYGFAWIKFPFRDTMFLIVVGLMVVPIQMTFVPVLSILNTLNLNQSYVGIWLAHSAFGLPFAIFLLRNFFVMLPGELIEAAFLDGASTLGIFIKIIMPLSVPALASLTIFQFLGVWNDLLMALIFIQDPNARPLTVKVSTLLSTYGTEWHLLSSGAFLIMIIPLIVFFALQRYFVAGMLGGAVKS
jgi:alpha-glucoside transport system permease protein